jgi:hypothetical protein
VLLQDLTAYFSRRASRRLHVEIHSEELWSESSRRKWGLKSKMVAESEIEKIGKSWSDSSAERAA